MSEVMVKQVYETSRWTDYILEYKKLKLQLTYYKRNQECHLYKLGVTVTTHFDHYFEDWLHPTEVEMVAFCLEHDLVY